MTWRWLVTGSRWGRADFEWYAVRVLRKYGAPELFVCGGMYKGRRQQGIDEQAWQFARRLLRPDTIRREYLRPDLPWPRCAHERDERMAAWMRGPEDLATGFPIKGSRGTHLTLRLCRERGARVAVCKLRGVPE